MIIDDQVKQHDDVIFGVWDGTEKNPTRQPGLLERVGHVELLQKWTLVGVLALNLKDLPLDKFFNLVSHLVGLVIHL
jgi:hypothetical protein